MTKAGFEITDGRAWVRQTALDLLLIALAAVAVAWLVGCVPHKPPAPPTPPTPPPVTGVPAKGQPVGPERLLRQAGGKLQGGVQAFGAVQCCDQFRLGGQPVNSRWPLAGPEWMDWTHTFGANFWHFRLGPWFGDADHESEWADIGGPYLTGGAWNPAYWTKVRELAYHAYGLKGYVEVVPIDTWYCKVAQWGTVTVPWPDEDVRACGVRPSPEQERLIRKAVEELGCFGNVIWATDNEGSQIRGTNQGWYDWVRGVFRDEEQKTGCKMVHMVGTDTDQFGAGFDYTSTHARAPLPTAPAWGVWQINNEHNPAFSPEQEAAYFKSARETGSAWWFWRAEMTDEDQAKTLGLFRDVIQGAQPGCFAPDPDDPAWVGAPTRPAQTLAWLAEAKAKVGDPKLMPGATVWDRGLAALAALSAAVRAAGHCASGPWRDALVIKAPDGKWDELHPIAFTDGGYTGQPFKDSVWSYPQ